jgi:hypothetical protein
MQAARREESAEIFPGRKQIGRLVHQLQRSESIVAVYEKEHPEGQE